MKDRKITDQEDDIIRSMAVKIAHALNVEMYNQLQGEDTASLDLPQLVTQGMILDYLIGFVSVTFIEVLRKIDLPSKVIRVRLEQIVSECMRQNAAGSNRKYIKNSPWAKPSELN